MARYSIPVMLFAMTLACGFGKNKDDDTDATGDTTGDTTGGTTANTGGTTAGTGGTTATDGGTTGNADAGVDSCLWSDIGVCYEFTDFAGTRDFCDGLDQVYGGNATYARDACPSGALLACDLPGVSISGGGPAAHEPLVAYYYDDFASDPEMSCTNAGGQPR